MPDYLSLFRSYQSLETVSERQRFALANPRLLWIRTIRDVSRLLEGQQPPSGALSRLFRRKKEGSNPPSEIRYERLLELDTFRLSIRSTADYPIGAGPLEARLASEAGAVEQFTASVSPDMLDIVAPPYLQVISYHGMDLALRGAETEGLMLARCAADAALALADRNELDKETFHAVAAYVQTSVFYLCNELDPSVRHHALQSALRAIDHAKRAGDNEALGRLNQAVGSLHSDIWTVPGRLSESRNIDLKNALSRDLASSFLFEAPPTSESWPSALESLRMAADWYRSAIPYRDGMARGLSYKAVVQTEDFIALAFDVTLEEEELAGQARLAADLLTKHPQGDYHMQTLLPIAKRRGWSLEAPSAELPEKATKLLSLIEAAFEPGADGKAATERRRRSHEAAVQDLRRVLRHKLPWALYLRNFDFANDIRMLGDVIVEREDRNTRIVVPQVSYSVIDHKVLELFGEGVVTICDPGISDAHLLSTIPMFSLRHDAWLPVVRELALASSGVVMLLDAVTAGVREELGMLEETRSTERTLIVRGHSFREGAKLPDDLAEHFPFTVDWLDFSHDERHFDMRYKAHGVIQKDLSRFVRSDTRQIVAAWLARARR